jgi:energy-converting hydrogenase Eha subunit E
VITDPRALRQALQSRGLLDSGDVDAPTAALAADPTRDRPWYITALLGASGWLAGLFMLGFVMMLFRPDHAAQAALAGVVLLAAAWGLYKADRDAVFVTQLALALSTAGQCLLLFAFNEHTRGIARVAASTFVLQAVLALAMPNRLHRLLSTLFAALAWALTVRFALFGEPTFWGGGGAAPALAPALAAWLLAWAPIGALVSFLIRHEAAWLARGLAALVRPILSGLIVGLACATLASQPFEGWRALFERGAPPPDWLALWPLLSALGALGALAAAFALHSRALIGACVAAALLHVAHFYYALGTGLLLKSLLMVAMGGVLLFAARRLGSGGRA